MNKLLFVLLILLPLISCNAAKPDERQIAFSKKLFDTPPITETEWSDDLNLWVKVDPNQLGIHAKTKAQELANQIANTGLKETGKPICVKVYFTSYKKVGGTCLTP